MEIQAIGQNLGAANSQAWHGEIDGLWDGAGSLPAPNFAVGQGYYGSSSTSAPHAPWQSTTLVDTTVAQALTFTIQMDVANVNVEAKCITASVEIIP
jgi:hypothetical protein